MTALAPSDLRRLRSAAALLSSDRDGEALGAVRAVGRLLARHGLDVADVVAAGVVRRVEPPAPAPPRGVPARASAPSHRLAARMCLAYPELIDAWERDFLDNIAVANRISDKQKARLQSIAAKVERGRR